MIEKNFKDIIGWRGKAWNKRQGKSYTDSSSCEERHETSDGVSYYKTPNPDDVTKIRWVHKEKSNRE